MYRFYNYAELFKPDEIIDYLRKSQSDDPLLTVAEVLAKHEAILDEWDERHLSAKVPEENRFREVVSGETIKERPEINKVLRLIESPKYKAIKIVEPQRLTRGDLEDIGRIMKLLKHTNTYIITADRFSERLYDLHEEDDWNAFEAELKKGNDYLIYYKKIQKRGRDISLSQGNYIASVPPYGYDKIKVKEGKKEYPTLKENPDEANVVRMIFDMYGNQGMGRMSICYRLDELGIKPPKGEQWSATTIKEMLKNIHYIGKVKGNWRPTITIVEDGKFKKTRPQGNIENRLVYEGRHNGIISPELFEKVQNRIGSNPRTKPTTKLRNPFATLLYCHNCGKVMTLKYFRDKQGNEKCAPRFCCIDQARCGAGSCTYAEMIDLVSQILEQSIEDFEICIQNDDDNSNKLHAQLIQSLEKKLKDFEAKELSQWEQQSHPDPAQRMPAEIFKQLNEKLLKEKEDVKRALRKAYESQPDPINYEEKIKTFSDAIVTLKNPEAEAVLKNELLKACIERIDYFREKPQRVQSSDKKSNWNSPPIELDVKLKV